jgi:hypothetical protein
LAHGDGSGLGEPSRYHRLLRFARVLTWLRASPHGRTMKRRRPPAAPASFATSANLDDIMPGRHSYPWTDEGEARSLPSARETEVPPATADPERFDPATEELLNTLKRGLRSTSESLTGETGAQPLSLMFSGAVGEAFEKLRRSDRAVFAQVFAAFAEAAEKIYNPVHMGDAAHDLNALAANLGLTFEEAAAKLTARETTCRATGEPRLDDAATVRALAGLEHLEKQFAAASGLPEAERARIGRQLVRTFERLQGRGVEMEPPPEVKAARRFLTPYNQRQKAAKVAALS